MKSIPSSFSERLASVEKRPFYAVEIDFDTAPLYIWTGVGNISSGGKTYLGTGELLHISGLDEVADMSAKGATITLSGLDPALISTALQEPYQGRECRIYFGMMPTGTDYLTTEAGEVLTTESGEPIMLEDFTAMSLAFAGRIDRMPISSDGESCTIVATVESRWVDLERPKIRRYTQESHVTRFPSDTFFSFVADLQHKKIEWGGGGGGGKGPGLK